MILECITLLLRHKNNGTILQTRVLALFVFELRLTIFWKEKNKNKFWIRPHQSVYLHTACSKVTDNCSDNEKLQKKSVQSDFHVLPHSALIA